jgi:hypothetical protein
MARDVDKEGMKRKEDGKKRHTTGSLSFAASPSSTVFCTKALLARKGLGKALGDE